MHDTLRERIKSLLSIRRLPASAGKRVLLTFDDGPHPDVTPAVLDRLRRHGARAVFFVVGRRIAQAPHLLEAIERAGHVIGNHGFLHIRGERLGFWGYRQDLHCGQAAVAERTGNAPALFRPPFGELSPPTLLAARSLGLRPVHWSLDAEDWRSRTPAHAVKAAQRIVDDVKPRDIVLLHDDHPGVLTILDRLLPEMKQRGLKLDSASWLATGKGEPDSDPLLPKGRAGRPAMPSSPITP